MNVGMVLEKVDAQDPLVEQCKHKWVELCVLYDNHLASKTWHDVTWCDVTWSQVKWTLNYCRWQLKKTRLILQLSATPFSRFTWALQVSFPCPTSGVWFSWAVLICSAFVCRRQIRYRGTPRNVYRHIVMSGEWVSSACSLKCRSWKRGTKKKFIDGEVFSSPSKPHTPLPRVSKQEFPPKTNLTEVVLEKLA